MNFAEAMKKTENFTKTENGCVAIKSTGDACLDLFVTIGSLREADEARIERLFADAYAEDPLTATKILFYGRDITCGLGERRTFRILLRYAANYHSEAVRPNLDLIGVYGRFDDLYSLIGTPLEDDMWAVMKKQFEEDRENLEKGNSVSLLGKWIKTADASSERTRKLGILTAKKLGYEVREFKRIVRAMRKRIGVVETLMSAGRWSEIKYSEVPSRAMLIYRNAFERHDADRFNKFINKAVNGEAKIHSATLYPYDIIEKYYGYYTEDDVLEAQWKQLPDYVGTGVNALVMADTSGSMYGRPLCSALGLAIYFAERNKGAYHNMWISFSKRPKVHALKGETLYQKLKSIDTRDWDNNTDLKAAFELILNIAIKNNVPEDEMPKSLIVISDMEIDMCEVNKGWTFYDAMKSDFAAHGYQIPNVVFWNVNSRHDVFHADAKRKGVQLCSGQSTSTFKHLIECIGMTPVEMMRKVIDSERYEAITVE